MDLSHVLGLMPEITDKNVLIGSSNGDDAGIYRISDEIAVVLTADFFTPIVDDPYWFGAISAANSLSDVWAMGAKPLVALNLAMFPPQSEFLPAMQRIIQGGVDKMIEAGVSIIGGHTIKDKEPKFGYAIMGLVHPDKILDNSKAKPGDALILTKKIGTGVIATGVKVGTCSKAAMQEMTISMATLNKIAGEVMVNIGISTATDITGFGLIGHLNEVLTASGCRARLHTARVPFFNEAVELAKDDLIPEGTSRNLTAYAPHTAWADNVPDHERVLMNDAQTSGGLLIFVPGARREELITALRSEGVLAAYIGDVIDGPAQDAKRIFVER
jgi:selenide,water dikinase